MHSSQRGPHRRGFSFLEVMLVVAVIGILVSLALPNLVRMEARSRQAEARTNLRALYAGERSFFHEWERYSSLLEEVGFRPERGNRYAYYSGAGASSIARTGPSADATCSDCTLLEVDTFKYPSALAKPAAFAMTNATLGVTDGCPHCDWSGEAQGNIDADATLDQWSISTASRSAGAENIAAGEPYNEQNDLLK